MDTNYVDARDGRRTDLSLSWKRRLYVAVLSWLYDRIKERFKRAPIITVIWWGIQNEQITYTFKKKDDFK